MSGGNEKAAGQEEQDMLNEYGCQIKDRMIYILKGRNLLVDRNSFSVVSRSSGIQFLHF